MGSTLHSDLKIGKKIKTLHKIFHAFVSDYLKGVDIKVAEFDFLMNILESEGSCQEELACAVMVNKSAATKAIRSLEKKGYVVRKRDEEDKRFFRVYSTPKARELREEFLEKIHTMKEHMLSDFSEEESQTLYLLLDRLEKNLIKECQDFQLELKCGCECE